MYVDYHVHSEFSDDSSYIIEEVVRDAVDLGIEELCFTDHVDYGIKRDWKDPRGILYREDAPGRPGRVALANVDYPRYVEQIRHLQEKYEDQIRIKLGLEFGMQTHTISEFQELFHRYPFDFIILSVHQVEDQEFWTGEYQEGRSREESTMRYYQEILNLVEQYHDYCVLGHLDSINRYDPEGGLPFEVTAPIIEKILRKTIADGKGIEVNTSCDRYGVGLDSFLKILEMYRDLGGRIITVGSDSHKKEHLGYGIPDALKILKGMGFNEICTYERMEPVFHAL